MLLFDLVSPLAGPPAAAEPASVPLPSSRFLLDPEASQLPKERLFDGAWATPATGERLQRLRREYPAEQAELDVYLACWNYFNGDSAEARGQLRRLAGRVASAQMPYLQLSARDGDWRAVKKVAGMTNFPVAIRALAYSKLRNRAAGSGKSADAETYAKLRERLLHPEASPAGLLRKESGENK